MVKVLVTFALHYPAPASLGLPDQFGESKFRYLNIYRTKSRNGYDARDDRLEENSDILEAHR